MLLQLKINNYLLIEKLELDFYAGLTVMTGETGSGKSIVIDALMLIFGARVTGDIIRNKDMPAIFEAIFHITSEETHSYLQQAELLDNDDPQNVICRRIIDNLGKSRVYVNGNSVTIGQIKQLGEYILDIHTQYSSITLLKTDTQRKLLDQFCNIAAEVVEIGRLYKQIHIIEKNIKIAVTTSHELEGKRQSLQEQLGELDQLNLKPNEWEEIQVEHKRLMNMDMILKELDAIAVVLDSDENSLISIVDNLNVRLNKILPYIPKLSEQVTLSESVVVELRELRRGVNAIANNIFQDPGKLSAIELRLNHIFDVARKYRVNPSDVAQTIVAIRQDLSKLQQDTDIFALEEELERLRVGYRRVANLVSQKRRDGANKLSQETTKLLHQLAILGKFKIDLYSLSHPSAYGLEDIDYQICFNKGVMPQSLAKAASGGELSRTALALYLLLSKHNPPEIIIFDEIDVGIGGKIAAIVGKMLAELAQSKQVICITHQAQTASCGDNHLLVTKEEKDNLTKTNVHYLHREQRVAEIARMVGGINITDATLAHAQEMITQHR